MIRKSIKVQHVSDNTVIEATDLRYQASSSCFRGSAVHLYEFVSERPSSLRLSDTHTSLYSQSAFRCSAP